MPNLPCAPQARNEEIRRLHQQAEQQAAELQQQAAEIKQLRQQAGAGAQKAPQQQQEQQRQNGSAVAAAATPSPASAAAASTSTSATPGSSRLGQDRQLEVPGSDSSWVSFNAASSRELRDAPTPTLLKPAGGSFKGSSTSSSRPAAAEAQGQPGAAAAHSGSGTPLEEAMRYKLDLGLGPSGSSSSGSGGGSLGRAAGAEQQRQPMRTNGSKAAAGTTVQAASSSAAAQQQLRSYPVQLTPPPSPLDGPRSAPASAKPSPVRTGSAAAGLAASGSRSPMQPGSPMLPRPGSSLSGASSGSPPKHRRHVTAPHNAFFDDLNPLQ